MIRRVGRALMRLLPGRGTSTTTTADPAGDLPLGRERLTDADFWAAPGKALEKPTTLDPAEVLKKDEALPALKRQANFFAETYALGTMRELFESVASMFTELFAEYRRLVATKLESALNSFKSAEMPATIDVDVATEALKGDLKTFATKRLDSVDTLKAKIATARMAYRDLVIGITGNPEIPMKVVTVGIATMVPVIAAILTSMYFEVVFNAPILQNQGNWNMAIAFSILVSFAGSITTFMAGKSKRASLNHRNAEAEKLACFPDGVDPQTNKPAVVLPMSGDAQFESRLWHSLMAIVITGTLVIRYIMMTQIGDIAGSFGVVLVFAVLYGWEAIFAEVTHPRATEAITKKTEAEAAEAELKTLEGGIASPEAQTAFDKYANNLTTREATERTKADNRKRVAGTFLRLASEFLASPTWFTEQFREVIESVVEKIGNARTENDDELSAMTRDVKPTFSTTDLLFDLTSEMKAAESITANVEVKGHKMTATEFDTTLKTLTDEMVKERATRRNVVVPAQKTRLAWKAPRLS